MSIDLDIFPTTTESMRWRELKQHWQSLLGASERALLGDQPLLRKLGSDTVVGDNDLLSTGNSYYFTLAVPNTLLLGVAPTQGNVDEQAYLEDYGHHLEPATIKRLANLWHAVGHYYSLTSMIGRSKQEPELFTTLAVAIAETCKGYVIVMNDDIFDLDVGVYTSEQFRQAKPKF